MELTTLRNVTATPLSVIWNGKQQVLGPYAEETMESPIATRFRELHGHHVMNITLDSLIGEADVPEPERTIWLANMTGHPDAPDELTVFELDVKTGHRVPVQVENRFKQPKVLHYRMKGSERTYIDKDGEQASVFERPQVATIPQYQVMELRPDFAKWILRQSRSSAIGNKTEVIQARKLPQWRPSGKWPLDHLRVYLRLCVPDASLAQLGPTEEDLKVKTDKDRLNYTIEQAKVVLLKRIFFCLVDPAVVLPLQEEFEDVLNHAGKNTAKTTEDARKMAKSLLEGKLGGV